MGRFGFYNYHMPFTGLFKWHGYLGLAIQILIAIAILIGLIYLIKGLSRKNIFSSANSYNIQDPVILAKKRLAAGEITEEEYNQIIRVLKN